jgi:secondary thiamine-phosphate synthase enzyme
VVFQQSLNIATDGRGIYDITRQVQAAVTEAGIATGLCQIFVHHTSASLLITENADPDVHADLESFMSRLAPDGDPLLTHTAEGPDDMPAHIRSVMTQTGITVPVSLGQCALGVWQSLYLWEHRLAPHSRKLTVTVMGE